MDIEKVKEEARRKHSGQKANTKPPADTQEVPPPETWEEDPLAMGPSHSDEVPPFPMHVFSDPIAEAIFKIAETMNCSVDIPATSALAVSAGCIGASREFAIKKSWATTARLNLITVGGSGSKKSPPMLKMLQPVYMEEERRDQAGLLSRVVDPKAKTPQLKIFGPGEGNIYVTNTTSEGLAEMLWCQRRGLIVHSDEIVGWLANQNAYRGGKGADRQFYLSLADGSPISIARKGVKTTISISKPTVSIMGGIQPARLDQLFEHEDGFAERFAWCYPKVLPEIPENWSEWDDAHWITWNSACMRLLNLRMGQAARIEPTDENPAPPEPPFTRSLRLTPDESCREMWEEYTSEHSDIVNSPTFAAQMGAFYSKSKAMVLRLSLIIELLDWVSSPPREFEEEPTQISGVSMAKAVEVVRYFLAHAGKVVGVANLDNRIPEVEAIWRWITNGKRWEFSTSQVWQSLNRNKLFPSVEKLYAPLNYLCKLHWIREIPNPEELVRGRPRSKRFEVHPDKKR